MGRLMKNNGSCIAINGYANVCDESESKEHYFVETLCFCKEKANIVLEKLIQNYRIINYQGIKIDDTHKRPALSIFSIDMDNYKGMQLIGSIDDFMEESKLEECKQFDIAAHDSSAALYVLKEAIFDLDISNHSYPKEFIDEVKTDLVDIYNKLKFKENFGNVSEIVGYGTHTIIK